MVSSSIRFGLIGVGGFARQHLDAVLALESRGLASLAAVADPNEAVVASTFRELNRVPPATFRDYREMLRSAKLDAVAIGTPLHLHCEMAVAALRAGRAVFMEKPPVVSLEQWREVLAATRESKRPCAIDFQWLSSQPIQDFKRWTVEGRLGQVRDVVAYSHQKRYDGYYERAAWAGKIMLGDRLVRDGSVNNPMAHQLNNALYLGSDKPEEYIQPARVRAELYRAHPIETEDTCCMEIECREGPKVYFYTTLCSQHHFNHTAWRVTGTKATAVLDGTRLQLLHGSAVKEKIEYKDGQMGSVAAMVEDTTLFLLGKSKRLLCPFEQTRPFVAAVEGMFLSAQTVKAVPAEFVKRLPVEDTIATEILDIDAHIQEAARRKALFSDLKLPWAVATKPVTLPAS